MRYRLLTGSTGFLGRYLLKDLLLADVPMAVMIRTSKRESTPQRLEAVMHYWEERLGRSLPRPVIFEFDVREPNCGLDARSLRWIAANCDTLIHSAASMNFHASSPQGEPFHSNVAGTANLLAMCEATGIRHFHQVSTAYICGLRTGRILESELDLGQENGNDYERSKLAAEKLIRSAPFLDSTTFYRPASIIGDSETGYTTNFHGFYAPLNVLYSMAKGLLAMGDIGRQLISQSMNRAKFMDRLNLSGTETKNLVPIDWVSAVTAHVIQHPELHGQTYHLTPRKRVTVALVRDVFERVLREYANLPEDLEPAADDLSAADREASEQMFQEQMSVYNSHWRDDPQFDCTNTIEAAPHLACPAVDEEMLLRTSRFSVQTNFGWPKPKPLDLPFEARTLLAPLVAEAAAGAPLAAKSVGLQVTGQGGGQWNLFIEGGAAHAASEGLPAASQATYYLNSDTFQALAQQSCTVEQAVYRGAVVIEGQQASSSTLINVLQSVVHGGAARAKTPELN